MANRHNEKRLWYRAPAWNWNEALPIGNGRLGGMVYGNTVNELVQLNEDSLWYGGPQERNNRDALANLPGIRRLLFEGRIGEAERLAALCLSGTPESQRHYEPLGFLHLDFRHGREDIAGYSRELDIETGVARTCYTVNGVTYTRRYFCSAVHGLMFVRLESDKKGKISFDARLRRSRYLDEMHAVSDDAVMLKGSAGGSDGTGFCTMLRACAEGGVVRTLGETILVEDADAATLMLSAATSFRSGDFEDACRSYITRASGKPFDEILKEHVEEHSGIFNRMSLRLEGEPGRRDRSLLPTDERLAELKAGAEDPGLVSLYFQFGRYLLMASSRPGTLPANLQGIWNQDWLPPWDSKYTININTEMNYWPAETCNLSEMHLPLFDHLERMREPGRRTARSMYACRGFVAHHNTDIWADTAPQDIYIPSTYWPMGAAWLCLHLWEHYEFTTDLEFLKRAYPVMREAAEFFLDYLVEDPGGRLVTCPSVSPENTYILPNGNSGALCAGPSMDSQILAILFANCIKSADLLGMDEGFRERLKKTAARLPKPQVGKYGQLMEWAEDYEEIEPGHRHISHLFALHPGNLITLKGTPELAGAARATLERRLANGGGHTGWSRAWIINMWARLEDGERAYENVTALLQKSTCGNLFDNHPPFQIDGNFGGTAGIAEMLLQSRAGEVRLLPALPGAWAGGEVRGLRARGGLTIDMKWRNGEPEEVVLLPQKSGPCTVSWKDRSMLLELEEGMETVLRKADICGKA